MISATHVPGQPEPYTAVLVAFDPRTGDVLGTVIHSALDGPDGEGLARSRQRLKGEIAARPCDPHSQVEVIEVPIDTYSSGIVDRVDPKSGTLIFHSQSVVELIGCGFSLTSNKAG